MSAAEEDDISKRMKTQSSEFNAVAALAKAFKALPAVVDDDYPEMRFYYERAMRDLLAALHDNKRIPDNGAVVLASAKVLIEALDAEPDDDPDLDSADEAKDRRNWFNRYDEAFKTLKVLTHGD